jgi:uncharacterized protein YhaN
VAGCMTQWQALPDPDPDTDPEASGLDAFDAGALEARIAALDDRQQAQQDERVELERSLSVERAALAAMDGNARIAELAEQAEGKLAEIGVDARRFVDLTLARRILEAEIEAYRRQNQGPLLERAGELFDELTLGAYPRVLSDAGEDGRGRIVAVRRDGREIAVEGLSSGTRDQLFLALRLATLAASIEGREPMPLVADDILIEFDDVRTRATLEVLARFAEKTQILLFSHHRHVAEFAAALGARAHVVEL